jgi:hypothetical protein
MLRERHQVHGFGTELDSAHRMRNLLGCHPLRARTLQVGSGSRSNLYQAVKALNIVAAAATTTGAASIAMPASEHTTHACGLGGRYTLVPVSVKTFGLGAQAFALLYDSAEVAAGRCRSVQGGVHLKRRR